MWIYDGATNPGGLPGDSGSDSGNPTTFQLMAPDQTPGDPFDNATSLCSITFDDENTSGDQWVALPCSPVAVKGM